MDLRYAVDVSSFFLIESSGDSEEDFDSVVCVGCNSASLAEDDAESCCCGSSDVAYLEDCSEMDDEDDSRDGGGYEQECYGSSDGDHGSWICQDEKLKDVSESMQSDKQKKQLLTEEDARMSEEEKNRLFWESCFAK